MDPRRYPRHALALDRLLDALYAFGLDEAAGEGGHAPLAIPARATPNQPVEDWPVASGGELRYLLELGHEVFVPVTATLRGRNDDLPTVTAVMSTWDVDEWLPAPAHFPPDRAATAVTPYRDRYRLALRLDGDDVVVAPAWDGDATGIVVLTGCAPLFADELAAFVDSFVDDRRRPDDDSRQR